MSEDELATLSREELQAALRTALARIAALEQQLAGRGETPPLSPPAKTAENSSVPPSQGWKRQRRRPDGPARGQRGPKRGHIGKSRLRQATADLVLECRPTTCRGCGTPLPAHGGKRISRRQMTELVPLQPLVVEARRLRVRCPQCQQATAGQYPAGFGQVGAFGPRLVALVGLLHEEHHVAYGRLVRLLHTLFGLRISEGALVTAVQRLGTALAPAVQAIGEEVRAAAVVGSDETSARVAGETWWEWVFQTPTAAYHTLDRRRNRAVLERFLGEAEPEVWVSDLWRPQLGAPTEAYQICLAHQVRDLQYAQEWEAAAKQDAERAWAETLAALLRRAIHVRHAEQTGGLDASRFAAAVAAIERECDALLAERLRPGASAKLQQRYQTHRAGLLTFLQRADVPPTNNASEQSLRPSVIHRKVLGAFRSESGTTAYSAWRTVADTARKRGEDLFSQLLATLIPFARLTAHYSFADSSQ